MRRRRGLAGRCDLRADLGRAALYMAGVWGVAGALYLALRVLQGFLAGG